jgi:hypothetical protein
VIAVVMRVDQELDALWRFRLQAGDANLRGVHELAVDGEGAVRRDEIPDRAAAPAEESDAAPDLFELRNGRRLSRRRLRGGRLGRQRQTRDANGSQRHR